MDFENFILSPVTLMIIVFGCVEFAKSLGLEGNKLRWVSVSIGVVLAFLFKAADLVPAYSPYIQTVFFGVAVALAASGIFSFINNRLPSKIKEE